MVIRQWLIPDFVSLLWSIPKDAVHICNGTLLIHKKKWNNAICSDMDGTRDYHTKWSKSDRERQIPYDIIYMWNLKNETNEFVYQTASYRKQT